MCLLSVAAAVADSDGQARTLPPVVVVQAVT
jgi:hypothetical protein